MTVDQATAPVQPRSSPDGQLPRRPTPWRELNRSERSARAALVAFSVYLVVAFFLLRFRFGVDQWFAGDDWELLVGRKLSRSRDWVEPEAGHWLMVPMLATKAIYRLFGLRTYAAYQIPVILLYLTLAALVRVTMRRVDVGPWTASLVAGSCVLFAAAGEIGIRLIYLGPLVSLVAGYTQLLLADHEGPANRRDAFAVVAGLVAVTSSGLGPVMIAIVGGSTLLRRGWRAALLQAGPPGALFLLWYTTIASRVTKPVESPSPELDDVVEWISAGMGEILLDLTRNEGLAAGAAVMMAAGLLLAWVPLDFGEFRRRAAAPLSLLLGCAAMFGLISLERSLFGVEGARSLRYAGWGLVLLLPAFGVAANEFIRRWKLTAPVVVAVLMVGVPANLAELRDTADGHAATSQTTKDLLLTAAYSPVIEQVPGSVLPDPQQFRGAEVTAGFLVRARDAGKLASPPPVGRAVVHEAETRLKLSQSALGDPMPTDLACRVITEPTQVLGRKGDQFAFSRVAVTPTDPDGRPLGRPVSYNMSWNGSVLTVQVPEFPFTVSGPQGRNARWCD